MDRMDGGSEMVASVGPPHKVPHASSDFRRTCRAGCMSETASASRSVATARSRCPVCTSWLRMSTESAGETGVWTSMSHHRSTAAVSAPSVASLSAAKARRACACERNCKAARTGSAAAAPLARTIMSMASWSRAWPACASFSTSSASCVARSALCSWASARAAIIRPRGVSGRPCSMRAWTSGSAEPACRHTSADVRTS